MTPLRGFFYALTLTAAMAAAGLACRGQGGITNPPTPDAGMNTTCSTTDDCGTTGICVSGLCKQVTKCVGDPECMAEGKVCHTTRGFCVECDGRHAGECPNGKTCQFDFTCVPIGSNSSDGGVTDGATCSGSCSTRTECADTLVCKMGACCPPPGRCASVEDCPTSRPECNGATGQCFGGGNDCFNNAECDGQSGCATGACFCDTSAGTPGICRARPNECDLDSDCVQTSTVVEFCTIKNPPRRCISARTCTMDGECSNDGLVCEQNNQSLAYHHCVNGPPCPMGNECNPTTQACVGGTCVAQNCINTPTLCMANQTCDPVTGACVAQQGGPCTTDNQCQPGYYCDTSGAQGQCLIGCRDNAECPNGVCNAAHQCEFPSGGLCGPCMSDNECPAGATCFTNPFTGTSACYEQCSTTLMVPCSDPMAQCLFGKCSCFL